MKTKYPVLLAASFAVAGMMLSMSGFTAQMQAGDRWHDESANELQDVQNSGPVANGTTGGKAGGLGGIATYVFSAASAVFDLVMMVVLFPIQLQEMGFPAFFALPLGIVAQIIAGIGIIQFIGARNYR